MLSVPPLVQRQVSDALAHISRFDFPALWPTLLPELVAELGASADYPSMLGLLETVCAVFERFRGAYDSDENRAPLKYAVDVFAQPLMARYRLVQARAEAAARDGAPAAEQKALADARRLMCTAFYLLNWLDLPEVFEDNLAEWVGWFHAALAEQNAATSSAADADEAGALEQLKGAALEAVELYAQKYEEEFEPFFGTVLTDVWNLLAGGATPQAKLLSLNMDGLVTRAIKFVTSVAGKEAHRAFFAQEGFIGALLTQVVVPNMQLRAQELEDFRDNPEDFMRADIEGNNADTRRRVATDLVRALCRAHNAITTPLCVSVVDAMLAEYEAAKDARAPAKDAAVALFGALAAKSATEALGVTAVNEVANLGAFLEKHVLPELQLAASADERPLAKAAAIKFIATFRGLFSREQLLSLLPLIVPFMQSQSVVVHTYSAAAVERILNVKEVAPAGAPRAAAVPRVAPEALQPMLPQLLTHLFAHIARPDYPENEYLM
jgi:exportin-2 (importin alpha re-exporter)